MKRFVLTLSLIVSMTFLMIGTARSFRNEKQGYKDFKWGMSLEDFLKSNKAKLRKKGSLYFGDKIKGVEVDIGYEFFHDTLYGVKINFPEDERDKIIDYFTTVHGDPTLKRGKYLYWVGSGTKIELKRKDVRIVDIDTEKEYLREQKKKSKK